MSPRSIEKMESFIGRLTAHPLGVLVICANLVFLVNIALLYSDPRGPVTGPGLICNQLPHRTDLAVNQEHSESLRGAQRCRHGRPTGGRRQAKSEPVISDGGGREPGMQYVIDRGNTGDPVWRRSKEENLFLKKQLKILTNTTAQSPRTCVGAGLTSILVSDDITGSQASGHPQYILPVMLGNQGPNNQLQAFHFVVAVAMKRNYNVVLAPFFNHPSVDGLEMRCFEDTLSPEAFRRLTPAASMDEFRDKCSGRVDAVLIGTRSQRSRQTEEQRLGLELYLDGQTQIFAELNNLTIPSITINRNDPQTIVDLPNETPTNPVRLTEYLDWYPKAFKTERKCAAFVYPYGLLGRFPYHEVLPTMSRYLIRPKKVTTLVDEFLEKIGTNGSDVICVHWRFNTEWKDFWCSSHGRAICETLDTQPIPGAAQRFTKLMGPHRGVMYFASPLGEKVPDVGILLKLAQYTLVRNQTDAFLAQTIRVPGRCQPVEKLAHFIGEYRMVPLGCTVIFKDPMIATLRDTVSSFYSSVDIRKKLGASTNGDRTADISFVEDGYHLSLIEQEICLRSRLFVASELSSWSANVVTDRLARGLASIHTMDVLTGGDEVEIDGW